MSNQGLLSRVQFVKQLVIPLLFVILIACNTQSQITVTVEPQPGIAFVSDRTGNWDIYVIQSDGGGLTQLTENPKLDGDPDWSPDGRYLIFSSSCVAPEAQLYLHDTETGETSQLTSERLYHTHPTRSHDGQYLALVLNIDGNSDIFILDLATYNRIQQTNHPAKDNMPSWSPDDSQIAFVSNRDGNQEVYIMDVDGSNTHNLTQNSADDWYPSWSPVSISP